MNALKFVIQEEALQKLRVKMEERDAPALNEAKALAE